MEYSERAEDLVNGLATTLETLGPKLTTDVDGLSTKQLRRVLKQTIAFITRLEDATKESDLGDREKQFLGEMIAIIEASKNFYVHFMAKQQMDRLVSEKSADSQGEEHE